MYSEKTSSKLIEIFLDLVRINSTSGDEKPVAEYIRAFLEKLDLKVSEDNANRDFNGNSGNIICKIGSGGTTALLAHMDTARPTIGVKPVVKDNRIQSDGNTILGVDNRAGIAVILYAIEKLIKQKYKIPDLTLAFTICEETSLAGSKNIDLPSIDTAFVFDSALRPGNFIARAYGAKRFKIEILGKASHSGISPEKGINSIQLTARALCNLKMGWIDKETTVNVGKIYGGESINVVPANTVIEGEVRSVNPDNINSALIDIENKFIDAANAFGGKIDFFSEWDFHPYELNKESKIYNQIVNALEYVGLKAIPAISPGGSDANILNSKGISTVNIGIGAQNPHSNSEFILLSDLQATAEIALKLISNIKD